MIYSEWRPDIGGFDYLEAPGTQNINDDLPTPELPQATKIGVPSIEAGRRAPPGAQKVGEGDVAVGIVTPVNESRLVRRTRSLGGIDLQPGSATMWFVAGAAGVSLLWYVFKKR